MNSSLSGRQPGSKGLRRQCADEHAIYLMFYQRRQIESIIYAQKKKKLLRRDKSWKFLLQLRPLHPKRNCGRLR